MASSYVSTDRFNVGSRDWSKMVADGIHNADHWPWLVGQLALDTKQTSLSVADRDLQRPRALDWIADHLWLRDDGGGFEPSIASVGSRTKDYNDLHPFTMVAEMHNAATLCIGSAQSMRVLDDKSGVPSFQVVFDLRPRGLKKNLIGLVTAVSTSGCSVLQGSAN